MLCVCVFFFLSLDIKCTSIRTAVFLLTGLDKVYQQPDQNVMSWNTEKVQKKEE